MTQLSQTSYVQHLWAGARGGWRRSIHSFLPPPHNTAALLTCILINLLFLCLGQPDEAPNLLLLAFMHLPPNDHGNHQEEKGESGTDNTGNDPGTQINDCHNSVWVGHLVAVWVQQDLPGVWEWPLVCLVILGVVARVGSPAHLDLIHGVEGEVSEEELWAERRGG